MTIDSAVDRYLKEVRRALRVSSKQEERILRELSDHIREGIDEEVRRGIPVDVAETQVIARMGDASLITTKFEQTLSFPRRIQRLLGDVLQALTFALVFWLVIAFSAGFVLPLLKPAPEWWALIYLYSPVLLWIAAFVVIRISRWFGKELKSFRLTTFKGISGASILAQKEPEKRISKVKQRRLGGDLLQSFLFAVAFNFVLRMAFAAVLFIPGASGANPGESPQSIGEWVLRFSFWILWILGLMAIRVARHFGKELKSFRLVRRPHAVEAETDS